jgi:hypothetical protein
MYLHLRGVNGTAIADPGATKKLCAKKRSCLLPTVHLDHFTAQWRVSSMSRHCNGGGGCRPGNGVT